jgi:hypothetical protein
MIEQNVNDCFTIQSVLFYAKDINEINSMQFKILPNMTINIKDNNIYIDYTDRYLVAHFIVRENKLYQIINKDNQDGDATDDEDLNEKLIYTINEVTPIYCIMGICAYYNNRIDDNITKQTEKDFLESIDGQDSQHKFLPLKTEDAGEATYSADLTGFQCKDISYFKHLGLHQFTIQNDKTSFECWYFGGCFTQTTQFVLFYNRENNKIFCCCGHRYAFNGDYYEYSLGCINFPMASVLLAMHNNKNPITLFNGQYQIKKTEIHPLFSHLDVANNQVVFTHCTITNLNIPDEVYIIFNRQLTWQVNGHIIEIYPYAMKYNGFTTYGLKGNYSFADFTNPEINNPIGHAIPAEINNSLNKKDDSIPISMFILLIICLIVIGLACYQN